MIKYDDFKHYLDTIISYYKMTDNICDVLYKHNSDTTCATHPWIIDNTLKILDTHFNSNLTITNWFYSEIDQIPERITMKQLYSQVIKG